MSERKQNAEDAAGDLAGAVADGKDHSADWVVDHLVTVLFALKEQAARIARLEKQLKDAGLEPEE